MWMRSSRIQLAILLFGAFLYVAILFRNLNESERRSLELRQEASDPDQVFLAINVVSANMNTGEIRARIRFRLTGTIANDEITPAVDLKLLLNSVQGQQEYDFSRGKRMNPIEAVFSLEGDSNKYPFDRHQTTLWFLITKPSPRGRSSISRASPASSPTIPAPAGAPVVSRAGNSNKPVAHAETRQAAPGPPGDQAAPPDAPAVAPEQNVQTQVPVVGTAALERREPVPISLDLLASIPGIKFSGVVSAPENDNVKQVDLYLRRADNVIAVSILVMITMMCLAMSLLAMAGTTTISGTESSLLPLSVSVSLIFGLPALRNVQPGVPPLGVFGDYVSFIWAELIVGGSTLVVIWTWVMRARRSQQQDRESSR